MAASKLERRKALSERDRRWVLALAEREGVSVTQLATDAGLSHTTLLRAQDENYDGTLSQLTIRQLTERYGVPGPEAWDGGRGGFGEEVTRFDHESDDTDPTLRAVIAQLLHDRPNAWAMRVRTKALEKAGYLEDDIVIADQSLQPQPNEAVCAQVYDRRGGAETVLRIYARAGGVALLLPAGGDAASEPLLIDDERVKVMGTVTESFRPRSPRRAA